MGGFAAGPMTVETADVTREAVTEELPVVGNLIGAATVEVVPKLSGRLEAVNVRLGDRVSQGQVLARVDDREIRQQVAQAQASFEVAQATVRQREADLKFAETNLERSRSLFNRQLLPQQTLDDAEARFQSSQAQLDLARAQFNQAQARLEELKITLTNTLIASPVDGFVGKRHLDPGAFVSTNAPVVSVVDIRFVRLVVNLVEKDLRRIEVGSGAIANVDAFPDERFEGRVARVAPVLDPSTRTAEIEIEIPNPDFRLKPGMYARVRLTVGQREEAVVIPRNAVVTVGGQRGVFVVDRGDEGVIARFAPITTGLENQERSEVLKGVSPGQQVVTVGAAALRDGDRVRLAGEPEPRRARGEGGSAPAGLPGEGAGRPGPRGPGRGDATGGDATGESRRRPPGEGGGARRPGADR
jgi:RND family efflux transporter MFP subunit